MKNALEESWEEGKRERERAREFEMEKSRLHGITVILLFQEKLAPLGEIKVCVWEWLLVCMSTKDFIHISLYNCNFQT